MYKFIEVNALLTQKEYKDIEYYLNSKDKVYFPTICKNLELKNNNSNLKLIIQTEERNIDIQIKDNNKIIYERYCLSGKIENIMEKIRVKTKINNETVILEVSILKENIIRTNIQLTKQEFENIKCHFESKTSIIPYMIIKSFKMLNLKDYNYNLIIEPTYQNISVKLEHKGKIILCKEFLTSTIESLIGVLRLEYITDNKKIVFIINLEIKYELSVYPNKIEYYENKLDILQNKFSNLNNLYSNNMTKKETIEDIIYNQIIYSDFTNEEELLITTYNLLFMPNSNFFCDITNSLYQRKLNYIGYDIEDFYENKSYSEGQVILDLDSLYLSSDILKYLIIYMVNIKLGNVILNESIAYKICHKYFSIICMHNPTSCP